MSDELVQRPNTAISDEAKQRYIGMQLLRFLDIDPKDGGIPFPAVPDGALVALDEPLQELGVAGYAEINAKKGIWQLTKSGIAYLGTLIDEASDLVDELDELETDEAIRELQSRGLDVFRARFLWGWFEGEFDDLVLWQERRGITPVERLWSFYLTGDELWNELAKELAQAIN